MTQPQTRGSDMTQSEVPLLHMIVGKLSDDEWHHLTGPAELSILERVLPGWQERCSSATIVATHPPAAQPPDDIREAPVAANVLSAWMDRLTTAKKLHGIPLILNDMLEEMGQMLAAPASHTQGVSALTSAEEEIAKLREALTEIAAHPIESEITGRPSQGIPGYPSCQSLARAALQASDPTNAGGER